MTRSAFTLLVSFGAILALTLCHPVPVKAAIIVDPNNTGATDIDPEDPDDWNSDTDGYIGKTASGEIEVNDGSELFSQYSYIGYGNTAAGLMTVTGVDSQWTNSKTLNVGYRGNGELAIIGGATVTNSSYSNVGHYAGSTGQVTVTDTDSKWTSSNNLSIGYYGNGTLSITNGGSVKNDSAYIGRYSGSTGQATVTGANSMWHSRGALYAGLEGNGILNITNSGTVSINNKLLIGYQFGSIGHVTVDGIGSTCTMDSLSIGYQGNGTLNIINGGAVSNQHGCDIGYESGSIGQVNVDGDGSTWTINGSSYTSLYVGYYGDGTLNITNGGAVIAGYDTYVGYDEGSTSSINFGSRGGTLTTRFLWAPSASLLGTGTINTHGLLSDVDLVFDSSHGSTQTLILNSEPDQNITINLDLSGDEIVLGTGYRDSGSLTIRDGVCVDSDAGILGELSGSTGTATITGVGSTWDNKQSMWIGRSGNGILDIIDGGVVNSYFDYVGYNSDSSGQVTVDGIGSTWNNSCYIMIGYDGNGVVNVTNGGAVISCESYIGGHSTSTGQVIVDGMGSLWDSSTLHVGCNASGTLVITNGGMVETSYGHIGYYSKFGSIGEVTVDGTDSALTSRGCLNVGSWGDGNGILKVVNGGTVSSVSGSLGYESASTGQVVITGTGSIWTSKNFFVGYDGKGTLIISDGGAISAESVSINSQSLTTIDVGYGSSFNIDNGSGSIENDGTVRILAGIVPTAGTVYTPIAAGAWTGTGTYQAVGGTWNDTTHEFTASPVIVAGSGQRLAFDRATIQRVQFDDAATGWTVGASFLAAETSTALDLTVTAIEGTILTDLAEHLDSGDTVLGAWDFDVTAGYTSGDDPAYLSFEVGSGWSRDDLEVWHFDGTAWALFDAWDLTYDGTYASFTVEELCGYAVAPLKETWIPGDCDGDNRVDEDDAATLSAHWGEEGGRADGDFNDDGVVDAIDASIMAAHWGDWTSGEDQPSSVPEPGVIALLFGMCIVTLRRRSSYSSRSA